ncbi:MAG: potassium channel protein [Candidatus Rokubacteria bacterium]|nr:potassium channel protein [Candidatus Rokubacteria bacterium]
MSRRIAQIIALLAGVIAFGTAGFVTIERFSVFDSLYMTVITVASVGFGEVPRELSTAGRAFTMVLIVVGVGSMAYGLSAVTALWVEGDILNLREKRRMEARIAALNDHIVVAGGGQTGRHIAGELVKTRTPFIVIEQSVLEEEAIRKLGEGILYIIGDATSTEVLRSARVPAARGLITCMPSDKDNVFTLLSARELNPSMRTVTRLVADESRPALVRAGADAIVSIPTIGALRLASVMLRPIVVSVLDAMLREPGDVRVEELATGSGVAGQTLAGLKLRDRIGIVVFAVRQADGRHAFNPPSQYVIRDGDVLIACATPEQVGAARKVLAEG